MEQQQQREQLQPAGQHIKHQGVFGENGKSTEILCWADPFQAGTDVVEGGGNGGEVGHHVAPFQRDQKDRGGEDDHVGDKKDVDGAQHFVVDWFAVQLDFFHAVRMKVGPHLLDNALDHDDTARYLDAATGAACAGADEHEQNQYSPAGGGPEVKVGGGKTGGCDDGGNLKSCMGQGFKGGGVAIQNLEEDKSGRTENDDKVPANFLHGKGLFEFAEQDQVVGVEVDAKQRHENGVDPLLIGGIAHHAVVFDGKAAGACGTKGGGQRVEQWQLAGQQKQHLQDGHAQINQIQDAGSVLDLRHQLAHRRAGALGAHQVHVGAAA